MIENLGITKVELQTYKNIEDRINARIIEIVNKYRELFQDNEPVSFIDNFKFINNLEGNLLVSIVGVEVSCKSEWGNSYNYYEFPQSWIYSDDWLKEMQNS